MSDPGGVLVVSTARSDFSYMAALARGLEAHRAPVEMLLTGTHFDASSGRTIERARRDAPCKVREIDPFAHGPVDSLASMGGAMLAELSSSGLRPAVVLVLGDRIEMLPVAYHFAAQGAVLGHVYGGECDVSYCVDTLIRNAVTAMSHLHFVMHDDHKKRLVSLGESADRVHVVGSLSLEPPDSRPSAELELDETLASVGMAASSRPLIHCCYHPVTVRKERSAVELAAILAAIEDRDEFDYLWTGVNSDPGADEIRKTLKAFCGGRANCAYIENLGVSRYFALLERSVAMVGNSSSGFYEAPSFGLPVLNVGERQAGRLHDEHVVDVEPSADAISERLGASIATGRLSRTNPFYVADGASRVADVVGNVGNDPRVRIKAAPRVCGQLLRTPEYA